jgi:hypothetical protein
MTGAPAEQRSGQTPQSAALLPRTFRWQGRAERRQAEGRAVEGVIAWAAFTFLYGLGLEVPYQATCTRVKSASNVHSEKNEQDLARRFVLLLNACHVFDACSNRAVSRNRSLAREGSGGRRVSLIEWVICRLGVLERPALQHVDCVFSFKMPAHFSNNAAVFDTRERPDPSPGERQVPQFPDSKRARDSIRGRGCLLRCSASDDDTHCC